MAQIIIWGYVATDGTIQSGSGFTVEHDSTNDPGVYYIEYNQAFYDTPAVTVTIVPPDYYAGWWINPLITKQTESKCEIVLVGIDFKTKFSGPFNFIAVGNGDGS